MNTNTQNIQQEEAAPSEVLNNEVITNLQYIGFWNTDQDNEIWVEIETPDGCYSGPIRRL